MTTGSFRPWPSVRSYYVRRTASRPYGCVQTLNKTLLDKKLIRLRDLRPNGIAWAGTGLMPVVTRFVANDFIKCHWMGL